MSLIQRFLDWIRSLFWKEEMELTLVGMQNSGKTTFVNVLAVSNLHLLLQLVLGPELISFHCGFPTTNLMRS